MSGNNSIKPVSFLFERTLSRSANISPKSPELNKQQDRSRPTFAEKLSQPARTHTRPKTETPRSQKPTFASAAESNTPVLPIQKQSTAEPDAAQTKSEASANESNKPQAEVQSPEQESTSVGLLKINPVAEKINAENAEPILKSEIDSEAASVAETGFPNEKEEIPASEETVTALETQATKPTQDTPKSLLPHLGQQQSHDKEENSQPEVTGENKVSGLWNALGIKNENAANEAEQQTENLPLIQSNESEQLSAEDVQSDVFANQKTKKLTDPANGEQQEKNAESLNIPAEITASNENGAHKTEAPKSLASQQSFPEEHSARPRETASNSNPAKESEPTVDQPENSESTVESDFAIESSETEAAAKQTEEVKTSAVVASRLAHVDQEVLDQGPEEVITNTSVNEVSKATENSKPSSTTQVLDTTKADVPQRLTSLLQQASGSGHTLKVRLNPPELGTLQIEVYRLEGQVHARLEVESPQARQVLLEQMQMLKDSMQQQGIRMDRIEVEINEDFQQALTSDQQEHGSSRDQEEEPSGHSQQSNHRSEEEKTNRAAKNTRPMSHSETGLQEIDISV